MSAWWPRSFCRLNTLASPILLFAACLLGALGVALALPRKGVSPQLVGALIGALGLGGIFLALGLRSPQSLPNFNFYLFTAIALGSALRVISHPRPVYAALYFILTILASSGLYVLLSAEFMAFALVIVYAGAILITYLFVIMLATESPTADQVEALADYDRYSREPIFATLIGFVLIAGLTTMLGLGSSRLTPETSYADGARLAALPFKVEKALVESGAIDPSSERLARGPAVAVVNPATGKVDVPEAGPYLISVENGEVTAVTVAYGNETRVLRRGDKNWPTDLRLTNVEGVGFALLQDHPGGIEVAGVVLLMAMLGAVVLARKKVELDEQAKLAAQERALVDEASERMMREVSRVETTASGHGGNGHASHGRAAAAHGGVR